MSEFRTDRRKRRNRYYGGGRGGGKRWRSSRDLQPGMEGVLLTCYNSQQHQCLSEAYSLLNQYGDAMYGPEQRDTDPEELKFGDDDEEEEDDDDEDEDEDEDDAEGGSRREGQHRFQSPPQKRLRRFMAVRTGVSNVLFIRTLGVDPDRLVHRIFQDLYETGELKSQIILRMLPVSASCRAMPEDLMYFLSSFLQPWFLWPKHATYQVCVKLRDSSQRLRDEIVRNVAGLVNELNPRNRVNRANPEISVIIEVIQSVCCISVLRDFTRFRKYNLQELAKERAAHKQGHPAPRGPPTQEEGPPTGEKEPPNQEEETNNQERDQQEATKSKTDPEEQHKEGGANTEGAVSQDMGVKEAEPE